MEKKRAADVTTDVECNKRVLIDNTEPAESDWYTEQYQTTPDRVEIVLMDNFAKKNKNYNILQIRYELYELGYRNLITKDLGFKKVGIDFETYQEANNLITEPSLAARGLRAYILMRHLIHKGVIRGYNPSVHNRQFQGRGQNH